MVITVGDSRIGKSTVIKLLIEIYQLRGKKIKVYDHDNRDRLLAYKELAVIERIDFFNKGTDRIFDDLVADDVDIILVDMPGQYIDKICQYIVQSELLEALVEYEWKLTFIQPISHRVDCIDYLNQIIQTTTNNANYVVVKNYHFAPEFREYESKIRKNLLMIGGTEIELAALHRNHYQAMEKTGKPYSQVCQNFSIILFWRSFIFQWIKNFRNSVINNNLAIKYLGLD
ncbi:ATP-binding protein [Nostoc paludosum FACHB-159]|uniref:ATP-binding protein n=2 Tax=Nostoc TaxID=1177 RepID=A0ABR8KJL9_9NOSO|nr:ATP-binding protein [Nostoc sp. FACHB-857]MBD2738252.1 ATP-binding protein [Nostoc paludosum FACHB-159]